MTFDRDAVHMAQVRAGWTRKKIAKLVNRLQREMPRCTTDGMKARLLEAFLVEVEKIQAERK